MAKRAKKHVSRQSSPRRKATGLNVPAFMVVTVSVILLAIGITYVVSPTTPHFGVLGEKTKREKSNQKSKNGTDNPGKGNTKNKGVGQGEGGGKENNRGKSDQLKNIKAILQDELKGDEGVFNDNFEGNVVSSDTKDLTDLSNSAPITD